MIEFLWLLLSLIVAAAALVSLVAALFYHLGLLRDYGLAPKHWTPFK
jgi:hypothetical protein